MSPVAPIEFPTTPVVPQYPQQGASWGTYVLLGNYIEQDWEITTNTDSLFSDNSFPFAVPAHNYAWLTVVGNDNFCPEHHATVTITPTGHKHGSTFKMTYSWDDDQMICVPNFTKDHGYEVHPHSDSDYVTVISSVVTGRDELGRQHTKHVALSVCDSDYYNENKTCPEIRERDVIQVFQ
eukprot:Clim_evm1s233 gene=Clim_evmTU1s233